MDVKQVIIVRKDLNMRKGKIAAQVAHASLGALLTTRDLSKNHVQLNLPDAARYWLDNSFTKICVYVNSEDELVALDAFASDMGIMKCLITDNGKTEFNGIPTKTCLAIGPDLVDRVNLVTSGLPLL